jgi:hypothetical protein
MITFICKHKKRTWNGNISKIKNYGTHYEINIQSRSGITVLFGKASSGYFACIPDYGAGCHLANLNDICWNTDRLTAVIGIVDGITVANALLHLYKELNYPEF